MKATTTTVTMTATTTMTSWLSGSAPSGDPAPMRSQQDPEGASAGICSEVSMEVLYIAQFAFAAFFVLVGVGHYVLSEPEDGAVYGPRARAAVCCFSFFGEIASVVAAAIVHHCVPPGLPPDFALALAVLAAAAAAVPAVWETRKAVRERKKKKKEEKQGAESAAEIERPAEETLAARSQQEEEPLRVQDGAEGSSGFEPRAGESDMVRRARHLEAGVPSPI